MGLGHGLPRSFAGADAPRAAILARQPGWKVPTPWHTPDTTPSRFFHLEAVRIHQPAFACRCGMRQESGGADVEYRTAALNGYLAGGELPGQSL
jgi:hypothetical protein